MFHAPRGHKKRVDEFDEAIKLPEVDEHAEEVALFEEYELQPYLKLVGLYLDPTPYSVEDYLAAIHFATQYDWYWRGHTPMELLKYQNDVVQITEETLLATIHNTIRKNGSGQTFLQWRADADDE